MKPIALCLLAVSLFAAGRALAAEPQPVAPRKLAGPPMTQDEMLMATDSLFADAGAFGAFSGVVRLTVSGKPILERVAGMAVLDSQVAIEPATRFNLGSMSKLLTRVALAQLLQKRKVKLDDLLGKFLPDYPAEASSKITVEHLVFHRSGVADYYGERYRNTDKFKLRNVADYIPLFSDNPLHFDPGTDQRYSNGNYVLLGAIIEKVSGQDYYSYVRDRICTPSGMTSTEFYLKDQVVPQRARGYSNNLGKDDYPEAVRRDTYDWLPERGSPAAGGYSTAGDLQRFVHALRTGQLLDPTWTTWVLTDQFPPKGTKPESGLPHLSVGFAGGGPGADAALSVEGPYTLVVLSNYDAPVAEFIARKLTGLMRRAVASEPHGGSAGGPKSTR